jgi:hypothetical protein
MLQNIVLIILIILLLFFFSNNNKVNDLFTKKYIKYLFILLIVYFIYQNYNFTILALALIILIFLNVDIKEKFMNNIYLNNLNNLNIDNIKNIFNDYLSIFNKKISKELFQNSSDGMTTVNNLLNEVKNVGLNTDGITSINNLLNEDVENVEKKKIEPFKSDVLEIKNLFESIKEEINKFKS